MNIIETEHLKTNCKRLKQSNPFIVLKDIFDKPQQIFQKKSHNAEKS